MFSVTMILSKGRQEKGAKVLLALQMAHFTSWPLWALVYDPGLTKRKKVLTGQPYRGRPGAPQGSLAGPTPEWILM